MNIPIITVCTNVEHANNLIVTSAQQGWDLHYIVAPEWKGFGTKIIETYNYLKQHPEIEQFIFCDAYDVLVIGTPKEFIHKLKDNFFEILPIISAEKGCWPDPTLASEYLDKKEHGFNYVNSGCYYCPSDIFIEIIERVGCEYDNDDQLWWTKIFLGKDRIQIDQNQVLFNSHSFIQDGEYGYQNKRIQINGNEPIFIHSNGRTVDPKILDIL